MPSVIIDGVEYVPKADIPEITDKRLQNCLEVLTEMRYHNQSHKMMSLAYDAIYALSPDLAMMSSNDPEAAYTLIHGDCDE